MIKEVYLTDDIVKRFSTDGFFIKDENGFLYDYAVDLKNSKRIEMGLNKKVYTETTKKIEVVKDDKYRDCFFNI